MARRIVFQGVGAAPGIGIGRVHLVDRRKIRYVKRRIRSRDIDAESDRFLQAIRQSEQQLEGLTDKLRLTKSKGKRGRSKKRKEKSGQELAHSDHLSILQAHRLMLRDPMLIEGTNRRIHRERLCAEWALRLAVREIKNLLDELADDYFRERRSDIDFVGDRILRNLTGSSPDIDTQVPEHAVIVAHDLGPADTLSLVRHKLAGFVTAVGGKTSHTAILARALEVPAVVAAGDVAEVAGSNEIIALDGSSGEVVLHPGRTVLAQYRQMAKEWASVEQELHGELHLPSETRCGRRVALHANIETAEETDSLFQHGAEGVGLLRTEYMFMAGELPGYQAHREAYTRVVKRLKGLPLTVRTFDLGGDKVITNGVRPHENNPALGLRAIRFCLKERELFSAQLRGILEASAHGPVRILFPMISGVAELREAKAVLDETRDQLLRDGVAFDPNTPIGTMIELPSAVWVADLLAQETDFFSVGTNDLVQYMLAADRDNERVAYLYRPMHASVLRALQHTCQAAKHAGIPLALCGEMASDPLYAPLLLGLGFSELSMHPVAIPRVKRVIRSSTIEESEQLVADLMELSAVPDIEALLESRVGSKFLPGASRVLVS